MSKEETYGLGLLDDQETIEGPTLPYRPCNPKTYSPNIGLIACGGITDRHLNAYKLAGYEVSALCDVHIDRARKRQADFYPDAKVTTDYREILSCDAIEVVDIATHPAERAEIIRQALLAGKHVLSQKPFALDLRIARALVDLAEERNLKLAVNQNGRWAPHFSYMRHAVEAGIIGQLVSADFLCQWDHNWIAGTAFDSVKHVLLYDYAVHWFDMACVFFRGSRATRVTSAIHTSPAQVAKPALLGHVTIEFETGQSTMIFNGDCRYGAIDSTHLVGSKGTMRSTGPGITDQTVTLYTEAGQVTPPLTGSWFPDGFHGTMAELLCAIEEDREPSNSARNNLCTLELTFAAVQSAETARPEFPGSIHALPAME